MRILIHVALATLANANTCLLQTKLELKSNNRSTAQEVNNSTTSVTHSSVQSSEEAVSASHQGVRNGTKALGKLVMKPVVSGETSGKIIPGLLPLPLNLVLLLYFAYTIPCFWYELTSTNANPNGKQRDGTIDFIRLWMHFLIILEHVSMQPPFSHIVWCNWKMGVFSVLSGIFGSHVDKGHLANVLCYTCGSIIMLRLVLEPLIALFIGATEFNQPKPDKNVSLWMPVRGPEWYLMNLCIWRFCVSPPFALMKHLQIPVIVPFILTCGISVFVKTHLPAGAMYEYTGAVFVLMPYFAMGLLRPVSWWLEILQDRRLQLASAAFYVLWFGFILNHYQIEDAVGRLWVHPTVSKMTVSYILMASMCLATMQLLALVHTILQKCFPPQMMQIIDGLGARTFYGYILHYYITVNILVFLVAPHVNKAYLRYCDIPVKLLDERMDEEMLPPCFAGHCIAFAISVHAAFILCSRLTEKLFGWMLMPYWMKSVASFVCSCCGQSPKKDAETLADTRAGGEKMLDASRKI
mmetsp:Transcript_130328/g.225673  ORF Transcript_130328/g.225673 Transcript_130328/m.225673 type:complete len:523 (+) Transcript_130328:85-1653(+)